MQINFTVDDKDLKQLDAKLAKRAINSAISRALDSAKTQLVKETVERYYVTAGDVRKTLTAKLTNLNGLKSGIIISQGSRLSLSRFKISPKSPSYRMKGRRYQAAVKKDGGLKNLAPNVFYIPSKKKMFKRIAPGGRGFKNLRQVFGPAIPQMLKNEKSLEAITQKTEQVFQQRLSHEVQRLLFA